MKSFLVALTFLSSLSVEGGTLEGRIVGIQDGDTVTLLDAFKTQHKIRLVGIDAPESDQPFGQRSKQSLSAMIFGKGVRVEFTKRDRYRRILGKIFRGQTDVNLSQIERGMAWHYKRYEMVQSFEDRSVYSSAEEVARKTRAGLWVDKLPTPPWDFRKVKRK